MKTQRQHDSADSRPAPDSNGRPSGANGDVRSGAASEPAQDGPAQRTAPQLPRRRSVRDSGSAAQAAAAMTTEAVENGVKERQVSAAATEAPTKRAPGKGGSRSGSHSQATTAVQSSTLASGPQSSALSARETAAGAIGRAWTAVVTYENAIYLAIFVLALVSRFYDIGSRALHHDESLHAVYSRNLYSGAGYQHDPMMHGPLQFHFIALMFWLFGTSDSTVRFASAVCGIIVV